MPTVERIPIVRCRLDSPEDGGLSEVRYIPLGEFGLWQYLMETRHGRWVTVEAVSFWIPEEQARRSAALAPEELEPVLRVHLDVPSPFGVPVPVERFFPAETYPQAQEALLSHYQGPPELQHLVATPGYVVPGADTPKSSASVA